jgi:heterodisulfide reductase subunit B
MKFLYYTGCVIPYRAPNYDLSTRRVLEYLGVELVDMDEAGCCGIYVRQVDEFKAFVLSARIWTIAESAQMDILSPCPGCVSTLTHVRDHLLADDRLRDKVNATLALTGRTFNGTRNVKHLLKVLDEDIGFDAIRQAIEIPLVGELAAHYGCHLVRPADELDFEDPELPDIIDRLIAVTGAQSLEYPDKMGCCGMNVHGNDLVQVSMAGHKLFDVKSTGAQALVVSCPACYLALGLNQRIAEKAWEEPINLPLMHLPQVLGLAMGISPEELGINQNRPKIDLTLIGIENNGRRP